MKALGFSALGVCMALLAGPASAASTIHKTYDQPASVFLHEEASGCSNNPGPFVTIDGELRLGGVNARIILSNNRRFIHTTSQDITSDVVIIPAGESISIHKQPPQGGAGGNPWIYLEFNDCSGNGLSSPILLGRCVQGLNDAAMNFTIPTDIDANVSSGSCTNHPGPFINISGEIRLGGLCGRLIFTNNAKFRHVASADTTVDVVLVPAGETITFAKQPPEDGAGGNPYIFVQFLDGAGNELGGPVFVGRCNSLE